MCQPFDRAALIALTPEFLKTMGDEEREFWEYFLDTADKEIKIYEAAGINPPCLPSDELREMYFEAIERYNGMIYCQMHQLPNFFDFDANVH